MITYKKTAALLLLTVVLLQLISCRGPEDLLKAFYKKGGKIEPKTVQVEVEKLIIKDGDTLKVTDTLNIPCPDVSVTFPPTRYEEKFNYKKYRDSLSYLKSENKIVLRTLKERNDYSLDSLNRIRKIEIKRLETELKKVKHESKSSVFWTWIGKRWYWWCIATFLLGMYTLYRIRKIKDILRDGK